MQRIFLSRGIVIFVISASGFVGKFALCSTNAESKAKGREATTALNVPQTKVDDAEAKRLEEPIPAYRNFVKANPTDPNAHLQLGLILLNAGHTDEGIEELREAVRLAPHDPKFTQYLATYWVLAGRKEDAIKEFKQAIQLDARNGNAHLGLGVVYSTLHQYANAIEYYDASLSISETPGARYGRIAGLYAIGRYAEAVEDCDKVLRHHPQSHTALSNRAYANMLRGHYDAAKQDAESALEIGGKYSNMAYLVLGVERLVRHDSQSAVVSLSKSIEDSPKYILPRIFRAIAHFIVGDFDKCIADLDGAIEVSGGPEELNFDLDGHGWQVYKFRGYVKFCVTNDTEAVIKDLTQAISLNDKDADCYALRAINYVSQSKWVLALNDLNQALAVDPNHLHATYYLTQMLVACPDSDIRDGQRALKLALKACGETNNTNVEFIRAVAQAYSETGDFANAIRFQSQVVVKLRNQNSPSTYPLNIWWKIPAVIELTLKPKGAEQLLEHFKQRRPFHERTNAAADVNLQVEKIGE